MAVTGRGRHMHREVRAPRDPSWSTQRARLRFASGVVVAVEMRCGLAAAAPAADGTAVASEAVMSNRLNILVPFLLGVSTPLLFARVEAQQDADAARRDAKHAGDSHSFKPLSDALGMTVRNGEGSETTLRDVVVDARTGECVAILLESGFVLPADGLRWNEQKECFDLATGTQMHEASGERSRSTTQDQSSQEGRSRQMTGGAPDHEDAFVDGGRQCILASALSDLPLMGRSSDADEKGRVEIGTIGDCYVDCSNQQIVFVTTSVGGVLGIGADSKVLPYEMIEVARDSEGKVCAMTGLSARRLEQAPTQDGEAAAVTNPEWRDSLYSYWGADRPDWEGQRRSDMTAPVRIEKLLDSEVTSSGSSDAVAVESLLIDPESSKLVFVALEGGSVRPIEDCNWKSEDGRFALGSAKSSSSEASKQKSDRLIDASALLSASTRASDGEFGAVSDIYFVPDRKELAYLTILVDTTLGLGGDLKIVPWSTVSIAKVEDGYRLDVGMTKEQIRKAPNVDGELGSNIYDPSFRQRIDAMGDGGSAGGDRPAKKRS